MHQHLILLAQSTSTTTAKSSKSSGSFWPFLIIVAIFGLVYFLFLRPRQQRLRQQQSSAKTLGVGDEVVSAGGIFGRVVALDADAVEVEVAPGVVMTFLRRAVSLRPGATGGQSGTAAGPVDEPWPDGPGDTAGPSAGGGVAGGSGMRGLGAPGSGTAQGTGGGGSIPERPEGRNGTAGEPGSTSDGQPPAGGSSGS